MIHVEAPAKVNLSLRVSDPDHSGLHPLYSRVQMIDWHDYLAIEWSDDDDLRIEGAADLSGGARRSPARAGELGLAGGRAVLASAPVTTSRVGSPE